MDPHKRHLKKLKRLQTVRKQKLKEKKKELKKAKSRSSDIENGNRTEGEDSFSNDVTPEEKENIGMKASVFLKFCDQKVFL